MELFLQECRPNLKNATESTKIQIVLGNEACDLDSAVSALVTAYYFYKIQKTTDVIVPVLNVKRKALRLRTEVTFFLEETSIPLDSLICIDEIDLKALSANENVSVVLVDHNSLSVEQTYLLPRIVQIIDHHAIDDPARLSRYKTKIEPVGSCCTLVAEEILNMDETIADPQIAMLLFGTILLDTICLQESAKRVTEKDKAMISQLEPYLEGVSREEVFETLQRVKFDISKLSPDLLLQKDVKFISWESTNMAIAALPTLLQNVAESEIFLSALNQFASENKLKSIILMGYKLSGDTMKRQIGIYDKCADSLVKITNYLLGLENPSLGLQPLPFSGNSIALFEQENVALTRKFILPAMQDYLKCTSGKSRIISPDYKGENINSLLIGYNERKQSFSDDVPVYQAETLDFPESPKHSKLLGITVKLEKLKVDGEIENDFPEPVEIDLDDVVPQLNHVHRSSTLRRIAVTPKDLKSNEIDDDQRSLSSLSNKSDLDCFSPTDDIILPDDVDTLEELENSDYLESGDSDPIPEMSAAEEFEEERSWKSCVINGEERNIDMKVIEPYRKVLSHGGYQGEGCNAIIIFAACYLPDRSRKDYDYVMDNLFLYVITTLDELVAEDYVLVYLHGATERSNMPSFGWLKRCYQMIDRRLRKNLKGLYLVHPTFWLKTIVIMTRPFISTKFSRKLKFVYSLKELSSIIPLDHVCIPDKVKQFDQDLFPDS